MRGISEIVWASFLDNLRNPADIIMVFFIPITMFFLLTLSVNTTPQPTFKANFPLPEGFETSDRPDAVLKYQNDSLVVEILTSNPEKISIIRGKVWKIKAYLEKIKPFFKVEYIKLGKVNEQTYTLAGVLAMSILAGGLIGAVRSISIYREKGILKLLYSMPAKNPIIYLPVVPVLISILGSGVVMTLALYFDIPMVISPMFPLYVITSSIISTLLGITIALFVKSSNAANGIASMFFTILPFFSGIYFPLDFLPKPLRALAPFIPTTWIGSIMKKAVGI